MLGGFGPWSYDAGNETTTGGHHAQGHNLRETRTPGSQTACCFPGSLIDRTGKSDTDRSGSAGNRTVLHPRKGHIDAWYIEPTSDARQTPLQLRHRHRHPRQPERGSVQFAVRIRTPRQQAHASRHPGTQCARPCLRCPCRGYRPSGAGDTRSLWRGRGTLPRGVRPACPPPLSDARQPRRRRQAERLGARRAGLARIISPCGNVISARSSSRSTRGTAIS